MALLVEGERATSLPALPRRFRHHAVFSYASADAEYVRAVHAALPEEVDAFDYAQGGMWGETLVKGLERRYRNLAPFCVVFLSQAYLASPWTKKELGIVQRVARRKPGYMLPVVLDGTIVPEIEGIVWLDKTLTPEQLAARLVAKIREPPPMPWWFYVSTEVKIALGAVLLALILFAGPAVNFFRPSATSIESAIPSAEGLTVHLVNSGPKSATLVGQRLKFGALPFEDTELRLDKSASATIAPTPRKGRDVKLIALQILTKCNAQGIRPKKQKVEPLLGQQPVTLEIDIRESNDAPGQWTRHSVTFPAARLKPLVRKAVSGYDSYKGC
jgi:TIR domain